MLMEGATPDLFEKGQHFTTERLDAQTQFGIKERLPAARSALIV